MFQLIWNVQWKFKFPHGISKYPVGKHIILWENLIFHGNLFFWIQLSRLKKKGGFDYAEPDVEHDGKSFSRCLT